jgi:DNA-binding transcriptional ArsR family regulator
VRIVGSLRIDGPATATMLAERLGESSGATSYHLRALAEHGFVAEDAARNRGRERWWKAAQEMTSWSSADFTDDPEAQAADEWLTGFAVHRGMEELDEWLRVREQADASWIAAGEASDYFARMTPRELRAMLDEINAVVQRHIDALEGGEAADGEERQLVRLLLYAFPHLEGLNPR